MAQSLKTFANPLSFFNLLYSAATNPRRLAAFAISLWLHGKLTGKELVTMRNGKLVLSFPLFVYDIIARIAWPMNYLINVLPYLQPLRPDWDSDKKFCKEALAAGPSAAKEEELEQLREKILERKDMRFDERKVVQLFDTLQTVAPAEMIGKTWDGHVLRTTSVLDLAEMLIVRPLQMLGFGWGKRYRSRTVGDPLLVNWGKLVYFPLPAWGNVSMMNMDYRGKDQATMRYCHQPWNDHFRVLDDGSESGKLVMLGVWCAREKNGGWFTLTHDPSVITPAA